jgi:hypothetical protein
MSGRPASGLMFFFGIETEPPRAGISATIRCGGSGAEGAIPAGFLILDVSCYLGVSECHTIMSSQPPLHRRPLSI